MSAAAPLVLPGKPQPLVNVGVIDVGSNAIRLQVAQVFEGGAFSVIHDEREAVRLGEGVFRTGVLSEAAIERALDTLRRYSSAARERGVTQIRSVATSAVRDAQNGLDFSDAVERETGLRLEVISGLREAQIIARGVLSCLATPPRRVALVDIGGGSTEISIAERGQLVFSTSIAVGSVRLTEMYCKSDPLSREDERKLRLHARNVLRRYLDRKQLPPCLTVVGSAGSIGALSTFIRRRPLPEHGCGRVRTGFTVTELSRARAVLTRMDMETRRKAPGIEEKRAEIIVAGALILEEICHHLRARSVKAVRRGLRDGLMLEEVERLGFPSPKAAPKSRFGPVEAIAARQKTA